MIRNQHTLRNAIVRASASPQCYQSFRTGSQKRHIIIGHHEFDKFRDAVQNKVDDASKVSMSEQIDKRSTDK